MINLKRMTDIFLELVQIYSPSGSERELCDRIVHFLTPYSDSIMEDDAGKSFGGNCGNLFVSIRGNTPDMPVVLLNAHMDSVEPSRGINPVIKDDFICSDGTTILGADDKAGIAIILEVINVLHENKLPHGDIQLLFTASEEKGLLGARNMNAALLKADFGYTLDGSGDPGTITNRSPTHDTLKAEIRGRAAHAGIEPEKGISAIQVAAAAVAAMRLGRIDDETTANIGVIRGGNATNIIPALVHIEGEARSHNHEKLHAQIEHMKNCLNEACGRFGAKVEITIDREYNAFHLPEDVPVIGRFAAAARKIGITPEIHTSGGGYDANIINTHGVPTAPIACGGESPHSTEEKLFLPKMLQCAQIVLEILLIKQ
ncbi:MAG: M20/M25/M40 family metallo-hydrolase [bacterium]